MLAPKIGKNFKTALAICGVLFVAAVPVVFGQRGRVESAPQSSGIAREAEDHFQEALLLCGTKQRELGRHHLLEAMRRWLQLREPEKASSAALQLADCHRQAMRFQDALYYYNRALEVKPLSFFAKASAFSSIAQVYADLYQRDLASFYYEKAIKQARAANNISARLLALSGLAQLSYELGKKDQAIARIMQARQLTRQQGDEKAEASLLILVARINQDEGMVEKSRSALEEALAICKRISNIDGQVRALCSLSNLSLLSSQKQTALSQAEEAVRLAEEQAGHAIINADKLKARELRWLAWLSQARAQRALGQKEAAARSYRRAIHHIEGIWWSVYLSTEISSVASREERQAPYRELVDLLIEQGEFNDALEWAERAKGRAIMNLIETHRLTKTPRTADQEGKLRELSLSIAHWRTELLSSEIRSEQRIETQNRIREAEYAVAEVRVNAEMERSRERLVWSQPARVKQLQEKIGSDKQTLVEFFLGENRSIAWYLTPKDVSVEILPGRKDLEKTVRKYLDVLTTNPNNMYIERDLSRVRERGEELFSILLGRFSKQIESGERVIVVPDGLLYYLPFEALIHNGRYLVEDHVISYIPSASTLALWQDSSGGLKTGDKMDLLAFGDPAFEVESNTSSRKRQRSDLKNIAQHLRISRGRFPPLPSTRDEVQYIASLFPPDRRKIFLGKASTEEAVKREPLNHYRRLHFATHSLIDEKSPSRSAVVLALADDPEEDGLLELGEISDLDLDCDLVVLSSCQTGRGQLLTGEGIVGLSRAFLHAGAQSLVVSLWNVNDISTGQLMKGFYQQTASNVSNAFALREAKLQMLHSSKGTRHPYYWAPFILTGKP